MRKFQRFYITLLTSLFCGALVAQEGLFIPPYFPEEVADALDEVGSDIYVQDIYQNNQPSIKDQIVYLSNGYSGVLLSENGLVLTNYRPFASYVHSLDSLEGSFYASSVDEEQPISHLSAYILKSSENIDGWVQSRLKHYRNEADRKHQIDSVCFLIQKEQILPQGTVARIQATVHGNYFLNLYQKYDDLRMVYAPAKALADFDQPLCLPRRHQADFSLIRIYVSRDNTAANYSEFNRPLQESAHAIIARQPYQEGDFVFGLGYPNQSNRLIPAAQFHEELLEDSLRIEQAEFLNKEVGKKLTLNKDSIFKRHAWLQKLGIYEKKVEQEKNFTTWAANQKDFQLVLRYSNLIPLLNKTYEERRPLLAQYWLNKALFEESNLVQMGYLLLEMNVHNEREVLQRLSRYYENFNPEKEAQTLQLLLEKYKTLCDSAYRPLTYALINVNYKGKTEKYLKQCFKKSFVTDEQRFVKYLDEPTKKQWNQDPILQLCADLKATELALYKRYNSYNPTIAQLTQLYYEGLMTYQPLYKEQTDANYTLRFSWGQIKGYSPYAGWQIPAIAFLKDLSEHSYLHPYDYPVKAEQLTEIAQNDTLHTDFLTTLDFPAGRMGHGVFNLNGELLGIAYGLSPEAAENQLSYEPNYQRSIVADIHYLLYLLDQANADRLVEEMSFGEVEQTVNIEYVQPTLHLLPALTDSIFRLPIDTVLWVNNDSVQWLGNDSVRVLKTKEIHSFPIDSLIQFIPDSLRFWVANPLKQRNDSTLVKAKSSMQELSTPNSMIKKENE